MATKSTRRHEKGGSKKWDVRSKKLGGCKLVLAWGVIGCGLVDWRSTGGASGTRIVCFGWGSGGLGSGAVEDVDDPGAFVARAVD